jgi:acetylornithine/N-succinyldiaminopimelate aminotransferase
MGRTGKPFAYQHDDIRPDGISLAKSLGNGLPIGAMLCTEEAGKSLVPGTHGSTFGGNLITATAANVVVRKVTEPKMLQEVTQKGEYFLSRLRELQARLPTVVKEVRGLGLLIGVELFQDSAPFIAKCRELGLLCNAAGEKTIRFAPAYVVTHDEIDQGVRILERALKA